MAVKENIQNSGASKSVEQKAGPLSVDFLKSVPKVPGVYLMKNPQGQILYVGKAKDLRKRLSSYQRASSAVSPKTVLLLKKVTAIDTILTHTEKEAFILEASLIKKHRPRFNIELKDDKSYPRIKVTLGEEWPRIYVTRRRLKDGSRYFGPYSSAGAMRNTLNLINRMFPLRRCRGRNVKKRMRPCLNYQMGRCLAPCSGKVDKKQYRSMVDSVLLILEGRNRQLRDQLKTAMQNASKTQDFEKAAIFRDQLQALGKTLEKQAVASNLNKDQDIWGYVRKGAALGIAIINVRQGMVLGKLEYFLLDPIGDDPEVLGEVLRQFYGMEQSIPEELLLPFQVADHLSLSDWLSEIRGRGVQLLVPKRGNGVKLLQMAEANGQQVHIDQENRERSWQEMAKSLQAKLNLQCFEPDDYRMMNEVLTRRFKTGEKRNVLPDLLVVDGGKGHLNVARNVLKNEGLQDQVELVSIAKDKENKTDKIYRPGRKNPISLPRHSPVLFFLMQIRDESHRFGIAFHRRLRNKSTLSSELDTIVGIGPSRKKILLKTMGSLAAVKKASRKELAAVPGIGPELAEQLWDHFH